MNTKLFKILLTTVVLFWITIPSYSKKSSGGVFVLGGIHQGHETAKNYTYERMGEIYRQLKPDILCVETKQKYVDDGSFRETPFDFKKFLIPLAKQDQIPIYGIDWWDNEKGKKWRELQQQAFNDSTLIADVRLFGGLFLLFNEYFMNKDFEEINSKYITALWEAKNEFKYHVFSQHHEYKYISEFERKRNNHIVDNIMKVAKQNPNNKILVAIGIDHKYYIEKELEKRNIKVYQIENIEQF